MLKGKENSYYLICGEKTKIGQNVKKLAEQVNGEHTSDIINNIMCVMIKNVDFDINNKNNCRDSNKFKRTAEEIIADGYRNGCCDSSTLFVALCRAKGIPAAQIITANIKAIETKHDYGVGHFYSAYYNKERNDWVVIDSHKIKNDIDKNGICHGLKKRELLPNMQFIGDTDFIFACVRDYSEFSIRNLKIDSIESMNEIHRCVYQYYSEKKININENLER